ncbi:MAG: hypothetical protein OEW75_15380, partial [Cyclobacteriaceae bacterium]|nr:hypothetical protein [Cyclobacteriaceae bacterium]
APLDHKGMQSGYTSKCVGCSGGFYYINKTEKSNTDSLELKIVNHCPSNRVFYIKFRAMNTQSWYEAQLKSVDSKNSISFISNGNEIDAVMIATGETEFCESELSTSDWRIFIISMVPEISLD